MVSKDVRSNPELFLSDIVVTCNSFGDAARDAMTRKNGISYIFAGAKYCDAEFGPMTGYSGQRRCHVTLLAPVPKKNDEPDRFLIEIDGKYGIFKGSFQKSL